VARDLAFAPRGGFELASFVSGRIDALDVTGTVVPAPHPVPPPVPLAAPHPAPNVPILRRIIPKRSVPDPWLWMGLALGVVLLAPVIWMSLGAERSKGGKP
jgi:hypothetical protein